MRITIDNKTIDVEPGTTILAAARGAGIEIPTLCHMDDLPPQSSCFLCIVRVEGNENFVPSCAAPATEGMIVTTHSDEITAARRTCLELLLSDHAGCCVATCAIGCPADLDIPGFTRLMSQGRNREAIAVIKRRIPLPAVLGYVCPATCEGACLRKKVDETLAIHTLHRVAAEIDLASGDPYQPERKPASGWRVAIVGAGPAGLCAAYYLLQDGHACVLFDAAARPGGLLRFIDENVLPPAVLAAEIALIEKLGAQFKMNWRLGADGSLADLQRDYDAVLLACGATVDAPGNQRKVDLNFIKTLGLTAGRKGIAADRDSQATNLPGVFAAGEVVSGASHVVQAVAAGHNAAVAIDQYLTGQPVRGEDEPYLFRRAHPTAEEEELLYGRIPRAPRAFVSKNSGNASAAQYEAARCLQCGCPAADNCKLRLYAAEYGAQWNRFHGVRRELTADESHPEIIYEPGKCVLCGLCLKIAERHGENPGLCFVGRGFVTRMAVPLNGTMSETLKESARACAAACPSGALSLKTR